MKSFRSIYDTSLEVKIEGSITSFDIMHLISYIIPDVGKIIVMTMAVLWLQRSAPIVALLLLLLALLTYATAQDCESDGTCEAARCDFIPEDTRVCGAPSSIYSSGGTAVAYTQNQPVSSIICDAAINPKYRIAGWPFSRSTWKRAPKVQLKINLLGCRTKENMCCCDALNEAEIEVWQARSDGTYSSLTGYGECRARGHTRNGSIVFQTTAPGSTGSLGGLGPSGLEFAPYGPPVVHILAKAAGHAATLVDVPVSVNMKTLEQGLFWGPDFRGAAWVRSTEDSRFRIASWKDFPDQNRFEVEVDILLAEAPDKSSSSELCQSFLYGLPSSFFLEPMAVCAPSMLDFFDL